MGIDIKNKSIIICGIVRDAEKGLRRNIPVINSLVRRFNDYKIVIFENDSVDSTKEILFNWQKDDADHFFICAEDKKAVKTIPNSNTVSSNPFFCKKRISKMVLLRNQYLDLINDKKWESDYLLVVDLDVAALDLDSILSSFKSNAEWDAVTALGYSTSPSLTKRYHDTYALTEYGDDKNPQTEYKIKMLANKYGKLIGQKEWVRVFSAFGGLAIYKFEAIKGLRYLLLDNNDPDVEVRCEHFSIYKQMAENGYNKVYINPNMFLKYQDLTLKIILNSLKRYLSINRFFINKKVTST